MIGFSILLLAAILGAVAAKLTRLPYPPMFILSGLLTSSVASRFFDRVTELPVLTDALLLGATFLVFSAGLQLSPRLILRRKKAVFTLGLGLFSIVGGIGGLSAILLGFSVWSAAYLATFLAASSTIVAYNLLASRQQLYEPHGRLALGVLLLQDLLVIVVLAALKASPDGLTAVLFALVKMIGLIGFGLLVREKLGNRLVTRLANSEEAQLIAVLAVLFVFCTVAEQLGLPIVAGAFLGGLALSRFPSDSLVRGQLNSLETLFAASFFTALGAKVTHMEWIYIPEAILLALLLMIATPLVALFLGRRIGLTTYTCLEAGLLLAATSEFSLVAALVALDSGHLKPQLYSVIVLLTIVTMLVTPAVSSDSVIWGLLERYARSGKPVAPMDLQDHIVVIGVGRSGKKVIQDLTAQGFTAVGIDTDPGRVKELQEQGIVCVRGEASSKLSLKQAAAERARAVISTLPRLETNRRIVSRLPEQLCIVRVDDPKSFPSIIELGGRPVSYVERAATDLSGWLEERGILTPLSEPREPTFGAGG